MVKKGLSKKTSKRLTCRRKYKIEKKIREHTRKVRKDGKEKQKTTQKKAPKPIPVPNKCPFKEDILREAQQQKKIVEEAKRKRIESQKAQRKENRKKKITQHRNLHSFVSEAENKLKSFDATEVLTEAEKSKTLGALSKSAEISLKTYYSEVKKVLERADVVLEVLDARDPLGSRSLDVESTIVESGKRLVLLLNKIDLIPKENVKNWLTYLRNEYPTIAFKASTQEQNNNLGRAGHSMVATSKCIGADILMKLLGNYCRNKDIKTNICVGIIGFPNVGKSSVINSLRRKVTCNVGAAPGVTKTVQEVHLDKKIRLLDSPGVVMASNLDPVEMALKNAVRVELVQDPVLAVEGILRRCTKDSLMLQYNIEDFADVDEFLCIVAKKIGRLRKGGVPDRKMAARKVLTDWNAGKIRYYSEPPESESRVQLISAELVSEMSKEFDLDSIDTEQRMLVDDLPSNCQPDVIVLPSFKGVVSITEEKMDVEAATSKNKIEHLKTKTAKKDEDSEMTEDNLEGNRKINKILKGRFKKDKKKRRRSDKLATSLSDALETAMEMGGASENYDFSTDFK